MKLTLALLLAIPAASAAFSIAPSAAFARRSTSSSSSTLLMASKNAKKIASRTEWAASRGITSGDATPAMATGLMQNESGLEFVKLVHPITGATSEVYLYGGVVTSFKDGDGTEFIAVRPDAKTDGSKPISGGLSHCWPQFGPGAIQQHGFARNVNWTVKSMTETSVTLEMAPSEYTKAIWDKEFLCTFSVDLEAGDQLNTQLLVENKGTDSWDFQAALHSYFTVSSLDQLEIMGSFQGKEFLNKMVGDGEMQTEERSIITISEEYDRVYKGVNDPVLKDAGTGKTLSVMNTEGWADTVLWSPYGNEGMGYNNFVCVESVKFDPVALDGGATWTGTMSLKPAAI